MTHPRLTPALFCLVAAVACSVADQNSSPHTATTPAPSPSSAVAEAPLPKDLKTAMKGMEDDWKFIEHAFEAPDAADLPAIGAAATKVAGVMKLAYDPWEDKEVPGFATFAREAERAFRDLAEKAHARDLDAVRAMGATMQTQHCARCHDAVEEVRG